MQWVYGYVTHCMNKICEDICKACFLPKVKEALFLAKMLRMSNLVRKLFEFLSIEELGKVHAMVLYSKKRWSSINMMFQ